MGLMLMHSLTRILNKKVFNSELKWKKHQIV